MAERNERLPGVRVLRLSRVQKALAAAVLAVVAVVAAIVSFGGSSSPPQRPLGSALPPRMPVSKGPTFFVDGAKGRDTWPGSAKRPFRSINHALRVVPTAGSKVLVRSGTYADPVLFSNRQGDPSNPITLAPAPGARVLLTASPPRSLVSAVTILNAGGIRIRGFEVTAPEQNNGFRIDNARHVEIAGNHIHHTGHMGVFVVGTCTGNTGCNTDIQVWGNRFHDNGGYWIFEDPYWRKGDHSIYWAAVSEEGNRGLNQRTSQGVIANNVFYDQPFGRQVQLGSQADGVIVTNNTFVYASGDPTVYAGSAIEVYGEANDWRTTNALVVNNIVAYANLYGVGGSGPQMSGNVIWNNLFYGNRRGNFIPQTGLFSVREPNLTASPPRFVDAKARDFRILGSSPANGAAVPEYAPPHDASGRPRDPKAPDLGAFETP